MASERPAEAEPATVTTTERDPRIADLPPPIRRALMVTAAGALAALPEAQVPAGLRKVRAFTPTRRAQAGAARLTIALESDPGFRRQVGAYWRATEPAASAEFDRRAAQPDPPVESGVDPAGADPAGVDPAGADPAGVDPAGAGALDPTLECLGLHLCRPVGWQARLAQVLAARQDDPADRRGSPGADPAVAAESSASVRAELAQARAEAAAAVAARDELAAELAVLRREQRRLRADADRARAATREAERRSAEQHELLTAALAERDDLLRAAEHRARAATEQLTEVRRSARDGRALAEVRTRLLLETIVDSAAALRRELALPPAARLPADLVAEQLTPVEPVVPVTARGRDGDDPELLAELLRMPRAHLLVDGYNVSMEGFGALALIDQRRLLTDGLSALAARTSAEITCCFDGAEVEARGQSVVRGVRVLFSDPGTTADDLIGRLVRAEPRGRVLVVISSDAEVSAAALAAGARSFRSTVLLRLLGAGVRDRRR